MKAYTGSVDDNCGLGIISGFIEDSYNGDYRYFISRCVGEMKDEDGTGFFISGFVNNSTCRKSYEELRQRAKLVYQSPVRVNRNSDNKFFFCVFDATTKE